MTEKANVLGAASDDDVGDWREVRDPLPPAGRRPAHLLVLVLEGSPTAESPFERLLLHKPLDQVAGLAHHRHLLLPPSLEESRILLCESQVCLSKLRFLPLQGHVGHEFLSLAAQSESIGGDKGPVESSARAREAKETDAKTESGEAKAKGYGACAQLHSGRRNTNCDSSPIGSVNSEARNLFFAGCRLILKNCLYQ